MDTSKGLRFNQGKNRLGLIPPHALKEIGKVFTYGANKYTVKDELLNKLIKGDRNWAKGMDWTDVLESLERHLNEFKAGIDNDDESGLLHLAHLATNAIFLIEFYQIFPEGDNRLANFEPKRLGLDIDEVLADFCGGWCKKFGGERPNAWQFDREILKRLEASKKDKEFWLTLPRITDPNDLPVEPSVYITHRVIPTEWSEEWLEENGFPIAPVITLKNGENKADVAREHNIDVFVDDSYSVWQSMRKVGIAGYLFDRLHNQRHRVSEHFRLKDFTKLPILRYRE